MAHCIDRLQAGLQRFFDGLPIDNASAIRSMAK